MTRDLRTLINLLYMYCTEPRTPRRMFENIGPGYAIGEQQRSRSGRNLASSAAVQADAIGEQQSKRTRSGGEQQLKRAQSGSSSWTRGGGKRGARAAVEADAAIGRGPGSSS